MSKEADVYIQDTDTLAETEQDVQEGKYLTFALGDEEYGIDIQFVNEIIGLQKITEVPDMPEYVKGVINLRGKVIPVMNVRLRFGFPEIEHTDRTCIIVLNLNDVIVGLIVDTVSEVIDIAQDQIDPPPSVIKGESSRYIKGMGKVEDNVIIILDIKNLLYTGEIEVLEELSES